MPSLSLSSYKFTTRLKYMFVYFAQWLWRKRMSFFFFGLAWPFSLFFVWFSFMFSFSLCVLLVFLSLSLCVSVLSLSIFLYVCAHSPRYPHYSITLCSHICFIFSQNNRTCLSQNKVFFKSVNVILLDV